MKRNSQEVHYGSKQISLRRLPPNAVSKSVQPFYQQWQTQYFWLLKHQTIGDIGKAEWRSYKLLRQHFVTQRCWLRRRTRFTEIGTFIFLSGPKFPRNRRFLSYCAKTGSDGAERFRRKSYVPQLYPTVHGWERSDFRFGRDVDKFVIFFFHFFIFSFVRTDFAHA